MITAVVILALLMLLANAAETPMERCLHRAMIAFPASVLSRTSAKHLVLVGLVLLITVGGTGATEGLAIGSTNVAVSLVQLQVGVHLGLIAAIALLRIDAIPMRR